MPETPIKKTRNKLAKIYGWGMLGFSATFVFLTALSAFLARLDVS